MARYVRQSGRALFLVLPLAALIFFLAMPPEEVSGAPYASPFWTNTSPSPECLPCGGCGCPTAPEFIGGVSVRTTELVKDYDLATTPGKVEQNAFLGLRWRSMNVGTSQMGRGIIPRWETTAQATILNPANPNAPGATQVDIRHATGTMDTFYSNGSGGFDPASCLVTDTLNVDAAGNFVLTGKQGSQIQFDANGMPSRFIDRNGNTDKFLYNAALQLTAIKDDRGGNYAITTNANGYITSIGDPAGRVWSFTYDPQDNLRTITSPTTPDQPLGITTTLNYDSHNRLVSILDGRGNTPETWSYVGGTGQVATATIGTGVRTFTQLSDRTLLQDEMGNQREFHWSGAQVTQTNWLVGGVPKYITQYRFNGNLLTTVVKPRGNREDFVWDPMNNLIEHRLKETDTNDPGPTDLVSTWTYNAMSFQETYTDPRGNTWTYMRDAAGNLLSTIMPTVTEPVTQNAATSATYNAFGQMLTSTDEEGTITEYAYFTSGSSALPARVDAGRSRVGWTSRRRMATTPPAT